MAEVKDHLSFSVNEKVIRRVIHSMAAQQPFDDAPPLSDLRESTTKAATKKGDALHWGVGV